MEQKPMYAITALVAVFLTAASSTGYVQADSGHCPCGDAPGQGYACNNCDDTVTSPTLQQAAFVKPDNCFWSYPVQCNSATSPTTGQFKLVDWGSIDGNFNNPSCEHHCYSGGSDGN